MNAEFARIGDLMLPVERVDPMADPEAAFTYIDISAVDSKSKLITKPRSLVGREAPSRARQKVRSRDVLVATTRPNLNAVAIVPNALEGAVCSTGFCVLRAGPAVDPWYLFLFVQSRAFIDPLVASVEGALYPAVSDRDVMAQLMPLPSRANQRRIATSIGHQLDVAESLGRAGQSQETTAEALREAIYANSFSDIVPISIRPPATQLPGWTWRRLIDLARLESGHTPSRSRADWWGGDVPWIALPDIRGLDGRVAFSTIETTNPQGIANSSARVLPADTVVMSRTASVGFVTLMGRPMATSQDFVNWVCGPDLAPEFLMHALIRSRKLIRSLSSGAIHKTVYVPTVKAFHLCAPPIEEQQRIAANLRIQIALLERVEASTSRRGQALAALRPSILGQEFGRVSG